MNKTAKEELRTLFIDNGDIASMHGVERVIHPAEKYQDNPVVVGDKPWEAHEVWLGGTVRKENGRYRMWYQRQGFGPDLHGGILSLYAESEDGINWIKPVLKQYEDTSSSLENNIYLSRLALRSNNRAPTTVKQDIDPSVLHTPHLGNGQTYTLLSYDYGRSGYSAYDGYFLAFSDDGVHWTDGPDDPVIPGHADFGWFTYDQNDRIFRGMVRQYLNVRGYSRRCVLWTESKDAYNWTLPRAAVIPDAEDDEWTEGRERYSTHCYCMPIFRYESMLLGFLAVYKNTACSCHPAGSSTDGTMDVQLVSSRDGRHWERVGDRRTILERGASDEWDWGYVRIGNSLIPDGDVVRAYYSGWNCRHGWHELPPEGKKVSIGMATWPRDRFVGLRAGRQGGELVVIQSPAGEELHVNADAAGGSLVAEISAGGRTLEGLDAASCEVLQRDSLDHVVRWRDAPSPGKAAPGPVQVTIRMTDAEIFSMWWH